MGLLLVFMFNVTFIIFQISQINGYEKAVDSYIESHGQLNAATVNSITRKQYGNKFTVAPKRTDDAEPKSFGEKVHYEITVNIPYLAGTNGPAITTTVPGCAVSEVGQ
jgi:hypothetical protein